MSNKIDERIPREIGKGALADHPAIKTPWEKMISFHDAYHIACRHNAVVAATFMQAFRILIPDYETRATILCENAYKRMKAAFGSPYGPMLMQQQNIHPFMRGAYTGALNGDSGDESLLMYGRVNDFGTYRAEKELDFCYWEIVGSDFCRATTTSLQGVCDGQAVHQPGTSIELSMVESRGCGDLHCRIVGENRDKYPMPPRKSWEAFGPIATEDQILFTPEEEMYKDSQIFRREMNYTFCNGTSAEKSAAQSYHSGSADATQALGCDYMIPVLDEMIGAGDLDESFVDHVIHCVFEAAGKATFGDFYAIKGLRDWLGVPNDIDDCRVMGGYVEVICGLLKIDYEIEAFNKDEAIYIMPRIGIYRRNPRLLGAYLALWYGMTKTLIGAQWSLWEENKEDTPAEMIRIKIARKIDKFN